MTDALIRAGLIVAHRLLRVWWFIGRPRAEGAHVIVRRRSGPVPRERRNPDAAGCEWEWLLVTNSYKAGVTLPGGGLRPLEQPRAAAR